MPTIIVKISEKAYLRSKLLNLVNSFAKIQILIFRIISLATPYSKLFWGMKFLVVILSSEIFASQTHFTPDSGVMFWQENILHYHY